MRRRVPAWVGAAAVMAALGVAFLTFLVLTGLTPVAPTHEVVVSLLALDVVFSLILLVIVTVELWAMRHARRTGAAGSHLHTKLVRLFALVAGLPTVVVAIVAFVTLDRGLDVWFSTRTRSIVDNSLSVARAYLQEHARIVRAEILATGTDINRNRANLERDRQALKNYLNAQATLRGLPVMIVFDNQRQVIERASVPFGRDVPLPSAQDFKDATLEEPIILAPGQANMLGAVLRVSAFGEGTLFVARPIDPAVLEAMRTTEEGVAEYRVLEERRVGVQVAFALMYVLIALIVLLSAIWLGLGFANTLVTPIRRLMAAASQVSQGNLYVHVPSRDDSGDMGKLVQTFNTMTNELRGQRDELLSLNAAIDERRRFTEAVLAGVSAGVISVNAQGTITLANAAAEKLLSDQERPLIGCQLKDVFVEGIDIYKQAQASPVGKVLQTETTFIRGVAEKNLSLRASHETTGDGDVIITVDDMTDLVSAQRSAAWGDVARRIAHEIKNPLTPIQLSAERLQRKYAPMVEQDPATFHTCIATIIRQVEDIKRMVDEFSSFARTPKPVLEPTDVVSVVRESLFLFRVGYPDIEIQTSLPENPVWAVLDRRLVGQVLTNLVKNATEAMQMAPSSERHPRRLDLSIKEDAQNIHIDVRDYGIGWPQEGRQKLLEPYVTHREKGTGLGLAIVAKIIEDHNGQLKLLDPDEGLGALARISLPHAPAKRGET